MDINISTEFAGIRLENPLLLSSGVADLSASLMRRVVDEGAAAVITKGISVEPREGHPNPTVISNDHYVMNAVGLSNPGIDNFEEEIRRLKDEGITVIANVFGGDSEEFCFVASRMEKFGVDAIEMNVSCPNVEEEGIGSVIGKDPSLCASFTESVVNEVDVPVIVKLTPNVDDIGRIAEVVEESGASAISAINTVGPGMVIDVKSGEPVLSNKFGGVSGPAIKPIAVASVYKIRKVVDIPIIGIGGVNTGEDAVEMMMAGASAVGIGSGVYYRNINIFDKVKKEILEFMEEENIESLNEIIGAAHE